MDKLTALKKLDEYASLLDNRDVKWALYIPSYTRPNFVLGDYLARGCSQEFLDKYVYVGVHAEELEAYKQANPCLHNYIIIPTSSYGLGYTRDYLHNYAHEQGLEIVLDWDDDVKALEFVWSDVSAKGEPTTRHSTKKDHLDFPLLTEYIIKGTVWFSHYLFALYPSLRMGNIRRQHFCQDPKTAETVALINKGATPRQTEIWKVSDFTPMKYMAECGNYHGEDVITSALVLQNGEDMFSIQQFTYDFVSESVSSTVRDTDENSERNRTLHAKEFQDLQQFEMRKYLKIGKCYPDGSYMYGDVDWKKFALVHPERAGKKLLMPEE